MFMKGFGCKVDALPSSLIERQDGKNNSTHRLLTPLPNFRARRGAVFRDSILREIWAIGLK